MKEKYIPALRFNVLTPYYDSIIKWSTKEDLFKNYLINQIQQFNNNQQVNILDLACGTATLTILASKYLPGSNIFGLDGDYNIIQIAKNKVNVNKANINFIQAYSNDLPFKDNSIDLIVSSLFFHHITKSTKINTFKEIKRILKPDGHILIADWGKAKNHLMRILFLLIQMLDGFTTTNDNVNGLIPDLMIMAGIKDVKEINYFNTFFGTISIYHGNK